MKLLSLTICNYKNYCGKQNIEFSAGKSKQNITLIGGQNGAGKTTLFEAVKLCMFGYQYEGKPTANIQYQEYIRACQNKIAVSEGDNKYYIEMEVVLDDVQPVYTVTIQRIWHISPVSFKEEFNILRDGHSFEIVEKENWQQYIYDLFPPYTIEYFFFDGEKLKDLVIGDKADSILKDSARDLIGLKIYDTLLTDIGILKDKIKKSTKKDQQSQNEYDKLTADVKLYKKQLDLLNSQKLENIERIESSEKRIEVIREEIQRKAGSFAKSHDTYQEEINIIQERLNDLNLSIAKTCDYVPFIMVSSLMDDALIQLENERILRDGFNDKAVVEKLREKLIVALSSKNDTIPIINNVLDEFNENLLQKSTQIIHDVNNSTLMRFSEFIDDIKLERKKQFLELLKEREAKEIQLQKHLSAKRTMPDSVYVEDELKEIDNLKKLIKNTQDNLDKIHEKRGNLFPIYESSSKRLDEIDNASLKLVEDKSKYSACEKLESVLQDFINYTLTTKVQELEHTISSMYLRLENKDDLVEKMKLNPSTFELTLIGFDGNIVNKGTLSSGEKEIYALSILWGLSKLSKNHLPIVVDSLLARLDESHVSKVAQYFLPNAGEQVLILSHNREVNKEMYSLIKQHISKEYLLSYDQKKKIEKGYFKECI